MEKDKSYKGIVGKVVSNILNYNFIADITEFKLFGEKLYLIEKLLTIRLVLARLSKLVDEVLKRLLEEYQLRARLAL